MKCKFRLCLFFTLCERNISETTLKNIYIDNEKKTLKTKK